MKQFFIAMTSIQLGSMMMNFNKLPEFSKEFKKLFKRYKTLEIDLEVFKKDIVEVDLSGNKNFAILHQNEQLLIIKARFFCRYLKGKTLRIIYAYYANQKIIEFIEIYFKGNKENEDKERIKNYLKNCN